MDWITDWWLWFIVYLLYLSLLQWNYYESYLRSCSTRNPGIRYIYILAILPLSLDRMPSRSHPSIQFYSILLGMYILSHSYSISDICIQISLVDPTTLFRNDTAAGAILSHYFVYSAKDYIKQILAPPINATISLSKSLEVSKMRKEEDVLIG